MVAGLVSYLRRHHIGLLALCIALTGTAYAATVPNNSVGTKQIKKNAVTEPKIKKAAVTGAKIKNGAVNSDKVKNGSLLSADFKSGQLPAGPQGAQGPQGPQGPAGATNVTVRVGPGVPGTSTASCQGSERAVGGGGFAIGATGALWASTPTPNSGTPTGWEAEAIDTATGTLNDPVQAYVVCASP
jgi:hypothetical protein